VKPSHSWNGSTPRQERQHPHARDGSSPTPGTAAAPRQEQQHPTPGTAAPPRQEQQHHTHEKRLFQTVSKNSCLFPLPFQGKAIPLQHPKL